MICREVLGTVADDADDVDWVRIDWPLTLRRALRLVSTSGLRIDVLLPPGGRLRHGDLLAVTENRRIGVTIRPCDVLALRPPDAESAARLTLRLGNAHLSAELVGSMVYTPADGPAEAIADVLKVPFSRVRRRFFPDVGL